MRTSGLTSVPARPHFFTAVPVSDGFEVRDDVLPHRVYKAPIHGQPTLRGRAVTNPLTLARINEAVDEWLDRALLDEIADDAAAAA